ncbi:MAG: PLP-dependent aminotransferase family protein [Paracoccaceae bacterium]
MLIPIETFFLAPDTTGTLQQRIRQMVSDGILSGRFRPGDKMPSSRGLAAHLAVSRITVTLAYADLVSSDYLTPKGRSGYFVSDTAPTPPSFAKTAGRQRETVDYHALAKGRFSGLGAVTKPADWRSYPYPFIYGQADASLFDHQNWRACALRALGKRDFAALTTDYIDADDPTLIEALIRTLLPRRGIEAQPEQVLLTLGAQNGLWLAAQVLLGPGRRAVIENPCYQGLRQAIALTDAEVSQVDVDAMGLPPDALPPTDVVFTTASHHCPTNATMPLDRRMAFLKAASERDFVIVEDDYEFEMSFLKSVSPSLKSLDTEGRVIHAGSFSKSLFPGLRLGYLVGPASFIREARSLRTTVLRHPPGHIQRTVAYFLTLGHYDALIQRMQAAYRRRRLVMEEAIAEAGLRVAGRGAFGGSSFWMEAPEGVGTVALAAQLRGQGVLIEPGRVFYGANGPNRFYRLAYSSIAPAKIPEGIARIGRALALSA